MHTVIVLFLRPKSVRILVASLQSGDWRGCTSVMARAALDRSFLTPPIPRPKAGFKPLLEIVDHD